MHPSPVPLPRLPSWVTTIFGSMRAQNSTWLWMPSTGTRATTTRRWTTTSCWWSWLTQSPSTSSSSPSPCPLCAPALEICVWCPAGETSTPTQVRARVQRSGGREDLFPNICLGVSVSFRCLGKSLLLKCVLFYIHFLRAKDSITQGLLLWAPAEGQRSWMAQVNFNQIYNAIAIFRLSLIRRHKHTFCDSLQIRVSYIYPTSCWLLLYSKCPIPAPHTHAVSSIFTSLKE